MKTKYLLYLFFLYFLNCSETYSAFAWSRKADFGGGIRDAAFGFSIGNFGYAGTGRNPSDKVDFWEYDPANNQWTQKSDYPGQGRYGLVGFSINGYGYAGTGWSSTGGGGNQYNDFWQYSPISNVWSQKSDFGGSPRYSAVGFSIGNKGYVGLGFTPMKSDFWEYEPSNDTWTQKLNFPHAREGSVGFGIGNKGYVGMGYNLPGINYGDLYEYDPINDTWTPKSSLPGSTRRAPAVFVIGNYSYVGMGYNDTSYLTDFYKYDPIVDQWSTVASIGGIPRYWTFSFGIGNYGYVGVGSYAGVANPIRTAEFWRFEECDGSPVGVLNYQAQKNNFIIDVNAINKSSLVLNYKNNQDRGSVFNLYDALGQLIIASELASHSGTIHLSVLLNSGIYFYSVENINGTLSSGKVVVY